MPLVGPAALLSRSNSRLVKTFGQPAVAVLRDPPGVEQVEAGGQDDVADLEGRAISSCWSKSMASVGQNFSQALQVPFWK